MPDRATPLMPPYTTLELLQAEHKRLKASGEVVPAREWHAHLAKVLWLPLRRDE